MIELRRKQTVLNELIGFCARLLDVKKPIRLTIEPHHPFAEVAVRKLKNGAEVEDSSEDYDEIEIFIYERKDFRQQLNETQQTILGLADIIHELLHVRHPDWDEDAIAAEETRVTKLLLNYMERNP